jgi:hypothetical protein
LRRPLRWHIARTAGDLPKDAAATAIPTISGALWRGSWTAKGELAKRTFQEACHASKVGKAVRRAD